MVSYQAFGNPFSPPRICALEAYSPRPSKFKLRHYPARRLLDGTATPISDAGFSSQIRCQTITSLHAPTSSCGATGTKASRYRLIGSRAARHFPCWPEAVCAEADGDLNPTYFKDPAVLGQFRSIFEPRWDAALEAIAEVLTEGPPSDRWRASSLAPQHLAQLGEVGRRAPRSPPSKAKADGPVLQKSRNPKRGEASQSLGSKAGVGNAGQRRAASAKAEHASSQHSTAL